MSMWIPSLEDVMRLHTKVTCASGGSDGVREAGLVESALARASAGFGGVELYPDLVGKAAAIGAGLTHNHGFIDGNKRIGVMTMLLMLRRNGVRLRYTQQELIDLSLQMAQGKAGVEEADAWIRGHQVQL